jgi:hypothetical protein
LESGRDQLAEAKDSVYRQTRSPKWILGQKRAAIAKEDSYESFGNDPSAYRAEFSRFNLPIALCGFNRHVRFHGFGQHVCPEGAILLERCVDLIDRADDVRRIAGELANEDLARAEALIP